MKLNNVYRHEMAYFNVYAVYIEIKYSTVILLGFENKLLLLQIVFDEKKRCLKQTKK